MSRVEVDSELCNGYGNCVMIAPEVFSLDEDTMIALVDEDAAERAPEQLLREAVADCPALAIRLRS